jgi:hypothetical protein
VKYDIEPRNSGQTNLDATISAIIPTIKKYETALSRKTFTVVSRWSGCVARGVDSIPGCIAITAS